MFELIYGFIVITILAALIYYVSKSKESNPKGPKIAVVGDVAGAIPSANLGRSGEVVYRLEVIYQHPLTGEEKSTLSRELTSLPDPMPTKLRVYLDPTRDGSEYVDLPPVKRQKK